MNERAEVEGLKARVAELEAALDLETDHCVQGSLKEYKLTARVAELEAEVAEHDDSIRQCPPYLRQVRRAEKAEARLDAVLALCADWDTNANTSYDTLRAVFDVNREHRNILTGWGKYPNRIEECHCLGCHSVRAVADALGVTDG